MRVAVLFYRIGPYHFARLKAAGARLDVSAVEVSNVDTTYAWDLVTGADGFDRRMLFSGMDVNTVSPGRVADRVRVVLNQIHPDVVAIPGWFDRFSLAALRWCMLRGIPAMVMSESTAWDAERKWWKEWVKARLVKSCAAGFVGGKAHANYLEKLGIERNRIFSGYNAVDNDYFARGAAEARDKRDETRRKFALPEHYFLASARFVPKKNLKFLIQAYASYRKAAEKDDSKQQRMAVWDLVLLGDGPLKQSLSAELSALNLQNHVHLPGFKQYAELPAYYGLASAFVHTSITEQWGLVVNEAMACGLPVLVSDRCGCTHDLVQVGANGFTFNCYKQAELARLMSKISAFNFPLSAFGVESRRVIQNWSPDKFAEGLEAACEYSVARHRSKKTYLAPAIANFLIYLPDGVYKRSIEGPVASRKSIQRLRRGAILPNFFIIGAPKSGTTSLSEYLKEHPNVFFSPVKEPHFFDLDASKSFKLKPRIYQSLFADADATVHKAVGEGSTGYLISKVAVSEILKFNPDAKFIVMLRNPVDLVQSWHSEMYFEGVENVNEFEKAWRLEGDRRRGQHLPKSCWEPKKLFYSDWGKLGDQIERLFSVASRDKVMVILFDDFIADTAAVYEQVLSFLGVPSDGRKDFPAINENKALRNAWLQKHLAVSANYFRMFRASSGLKLSLGLGLLPKVLFLNSKPAFRRPVSPAMREELACFYEQDIRKLSSLIGRDLSAWTSKIPNRRECVP